MDFKVGDIVYYDKDVYANFRHYLYDRKHIITKIEEGVIYTQGYNWKYSDIESTSHDELRTSEKSLQRAIKLVSPHVWTGSKLVFNFIR